MLNQNIPLRIKTAWDLQAARDRRHIEEHGGKRPDYVYYKGSRYGMITSGDNRVKCLACQELFEGREEAKGHECPYEAEWRMATGRQAGAERPKDQSLVQRIEELEAKVQILDSIVNPEFETGGANNGESNLR